MSRGRWGTFANAYPGRLPVWLRVQRQGRLFTAFASQDGSTWAQVGPARQISMSDPVFAGVAVTAHNSNRVCVADVDQVSVR